MPLLDAFNFNPMAYSGANGPDQNMLAALLRKGQELGGLASPEVTAGGVPPPPGHEPFRMPQGTQSLDSSPLPEVITGPANGDGSPGPAMAFAGNPPSSGASVPLPRPRPDDAPDEEDPAIPPRAQPTAGLGGLLSPAMPPAAPAPQGGMPPVPQGLLERLGINGNTLMALGAGIAGGRTWGDGIAQGLAGAAASRAYDQKESEKTKIAAATYRSLVSRGVPPADALAAVQNPEILRTIAADKFGHGDRDFALRQDEAKRNQANADRSFSLAQRAADRADEGPVQTAEQRAQAARAQGLEPGTPQYKAYVLTGQLPEGNSTVSAQTEQRKQAAASLGLTPEHPAYQSFVLTGKMPREDAQPLTATDKKAILEADEGVLAAQTGIDALKRAKQISPNALGFRGAGLLSTVASPVVPSGLGGDALGATVDLDNVVTGNALTQLRSIFGGNPTEGERAIMLQIQGSSGLPDKSRQKIYDRAIALAEKRLQFNQQRADELRGNTFYKAKKPGEPAAAPAAPDPLGIR